MWDWKLKDIHLVDLSAKKTNLRTLKMVEESAGTGMGKIFNGCAKI